MSGKALQDALRLKDHMHFRRHYLLPTLEAGSIEMTIPDKPKSPSQRYRLTRLGLEVLNQSKAAETETT